MPKKSPEMGRKDADFLDTADQPAIAKKYFHGNANPSSCDWMLRLSQHQTTPSGEEIEITAEMLSEILAPCEAFIFQLEQGTENGYRHWQAFARWHSHTRLSTIRKLFTDRNLICSYIMPRKHSVLSCVAYCSKEETRLEGPVQKGSFPDAKPTKSRAAAYSECVEALEQGHSTQELLTNPDFKETASLKLPALKALESASLYAQAQQPRDVKAFYLWGPPRTGKTYSVQHLRHTPQECYLYDPLNRNPWDDYTNQTVLVIDEFAAQPDFHSLCQWLEPYPCTLPARYAPRYALWNEVWIVSNISLQQATALYRRHGIPEEMLPSLAGRICAEIHRTASGETTSVPPEYARLQESLEAIKAIPLAPLP